MVAADLVQEFINIMTFDKSERVPAIQGMKLNAVGSAGTVATASSHDEL